MSVVVGVLLVAVAAALVLATGLAATLALRVRELPKLLLGAYVIAFAEAIGLILVLSAFEALTRPGILVGATIVFAAVAAGWLRLRTPRPAPLRLERVRVLGQVRPLLVLAVVTALALMYTLGLVVGTPPSNHDSLSYHLTRAAFWSQQDGIGYIADAYDERMNAHPPNAELALTFVLELGRHEQLAGFVQFVAALAVAVGIFALARKLGIARREAAFGALVFLTLPVVLLQTTTSQNDLVAASFLMAATVFVLGRSPGELGLAALATALAIGTKVPTAYGLPLLAAIALLAPPRTARVPRLAALAVGVAAGSYWYVVNLARSGHPFGDLREESTGLSALLQPAENALGAYARFIDAIDLSGSEGVDVLAYFIVGGALTVGLLLGARGDRAKVAPALVTGALTVTPLVFLPVGYLLWRGLIAMDGPDVLEKGFLPLRVWRKTFASDTVSWYGPVGFLLVVGAGIAAVVLVRRRSLPRVALVMAAAPLVWLVLLSLSLGYDLTQGRFFMFPVALSASLWGLALRIDRYAVATVAIASTTAFLTLVNSNEKPSGLRLLRSEVPASVWSAERWEAQSRPEPRTRPALRFLDELPRTASIALALSYNDFGFPAFGPRLERHVEFVPDASRAGTSDADWLLASRTRAVRIDRRCWRVVLEGRGGWVGFQRRVRACSVTEDAVP